MTVHAAAATVTSPWFTAVVALIVGVGGGGGITALLKVGADRGKVVIEAAQGAVIVQTGVIEALQEELNRLKAERESDREEIVRLRTEVRQLRASNADTASRLSQVEQATDPDINGH